VDGLATGVGLFATLTTFLRRFFRTIRRSRSHCPARWRTARVLAVQLQSRVHFSWRFGSLSIGFYWAATARIWSEKSATLLGMTAPLMALAIPLLDTGLAIVRRFLRHQPISPRIGNHIHHRLLDRGFSPRRVALCSTECAASERLFPAAEHARK